jgi:hypothetical protein
VPQELDNFILKSTQGIGHIAVVVNARGFIATFPQRQFLWATTEVSTPDSETHRLPASIATAG